MFLKKKTSENISCRGFPTSSNCSLNVITPSFSISILDQFPSQPTISHHHQDEEPEVIVNIVDIDRQKLIDKLLEQQKLLFRRNENIAFLNNHIQLLR